MTFWLLAFWISLATIFYTYIGYGLLVYLLISIKAIFRPSPSVPQAGEYLPEVSLVVAAYNEKGFIEQKIENSLSLNYPREKLKLVFVTDGSDDGTDKIVAKYSEIKCYHQPQRSGKLAAIQRIWHYIDTPVAVLTDANSTLNPDAIRQLVRHFADPKTGAVAGEKKVVVEQEDHAGSAGEGFYWRYESQLKKWDAELHTVVGAAGELFAIRTELYEMLPLNTLIEDFHQSLRVTQKGYRVAYEDQAVALEAASVSVAEELKRKVRIAAGGIQAIVRLRSLLNPFAWGWTSFQYISHRVLRWTLAPLFLPILLISNVILAADGNLFYTLSAWGQVFFYLFAFLGWILENRKLRIKLLFIPYYFCVMNYAVYAGFVKYLRGKQSVNWERAQRQVTPRT